MGVGMTESQDSRVEIDAFMESWQGEDQPMRDRFQLFIGKLSAMEDVGLSFVARPGVSYSIRPKHNKQQERDLFAMVDVIDDDPEERWLSVCFYGDMITDPEERGEVIPGGLAGSDGYCFDMFDDDQSLVDYLLDRFNEAAAAASA